MNGDGDAHEFDFLFCTPPGDPYGEGTVGWMARLLMLIVVIFSTLVAMLFLGFFTDPPKAQDLGIKPASAAGTAQCASGATGLHVSEIILACEGFQDTQLPNVFPEVPPAVATPTPAAPVETPTPTPATSTSTPTSTSTSTSASSSSTHIVTPPPPPANCIPNTMTADGSTVSGSGNTRSSERVYTWNSGAVSGTVTFSISGLNLGSTCSPHYSLVARGPGGYGYSCGPYSSLSVQGSVLNNETWTMWVDMEPSGCPSSAPH